MQSAVSGEGPGLAHFFSPYYREHNRARLEHLASLGLPLENRRVLELGSGPGDHTGFYIERQCAMVAVDARQECLDVLRQRYPKVATVQCDLNSPETLLGLGSFEVVHCYGILYHLERPDALMAYIARACSGIALVETCVNRGTGREVSVANEFQTDFTQSSTGRACRPSRQWVFDELRRGFTFVYLTKTQPNHPEFPTDWNDLAGTPDFIRSVFVASKQQCNLSSLSQVLFDRQERFQA